jgi:hydroxymethylpyrimidine pyrophosphatase-like HAD family hydrolase
LIKRYEELSGTKQINNDDVRSGEDFVSKVEALERENGVDQLDACKCLIFSETYKIDQTYNAFTAKSNSAFNIVRGCPPFFIELLPPKISKGEGLLTMLQSLQQNNIDSISPSEVLAFGDGENDIEFLSAVGWGCAMKNATERTKAAADEVLELNNEEQGVRDKILRSLKEEGGFALK